MTPYALRWPLVALALAALLAAAAPVMADPPTRVARLNYLKGSVSFRPATLDDWGPATLNYPLTTGDHLWTDGDSWAEMHVGSTAIRLAPFTAFAFLNLDDGMTQLRVSEGALDVRVRNAEYGSGFEIDTPSAAIVVTRPGVYRVDVLPDGGSTRVTVRYGAAEVFADGPSFWVNEGQAAAIYGTDDVSHEVFRAGPADNWEQWCRMRDEREDRAVSLRYVSYEMTGYEDLDDYGTWQSVPEYGWAWQPTRVVEGWAPYRHGHWRWVEPWGWTWIDDAPWGFAPFHYGRWAHHRGAWLWVPGAYVTRPVYAPALVAFIGGDRWRVSFGLGHAHTLGWFPLAPGEFWMPRYRASHAYIRNLNVTNVNITNININNYQVSHGTYVNRAIAGAVTAVPRDVFVTGRAVPRQSLVVDRRAAMTSEVVGTSAPVAPRTESLLPQSGGVRRPSSSALTRSVVARTEPPAAPVPFQARERALQAQAGQPLDESALAGLRGRTSREAGGGLGSPVRLAGRATRRDDAARGVVAQEEQGASTRPGGEPAPGTAARRDGRRTRPDASDETPPTSPAPAGRSGSGLNDRPGWARPRGSSAGQPAAPGTWDRGSESRGTQTVPERGEGVGIPQARPRYGERPPDEGLGSGAALPSAAREGARPGAPAGARGRWGGEAGQPERPSANERPTPSRSWSTEPARPSGGDEGARRRSAGAPGRPSSSEPERSSGGGPARPSGGLAGARPRSGGDRIQSSEPARPPAPARPSGGAGVAAPRGGERGGAQPANPSGRPPGGARPRHGGLN